MFSKGIEFGGFCVRLDVGEYFIDKLKSLKEKYSFITDVRGRGLLLAVEFDSEIAQDVVAGCIENGLLVNRLKTTAIRFIPPLIITNNDVDEALGILDKVLSGVKS